MQPSTKKNPNEEARARLALTKINSVQFLTEQAVDAGTKSIVNVSSFLCANHRGAPFSTAYQSGVEALTRYFAQKCKGKVRVNGVRPGLCDTDMLHENMSSEFVSAFLETHVPNRRLITPREFGEVVYFIGTNPLLTGQIVTADLGATINNGVYW